MPKSKSGKSRRSKTSKGSKGSKRSKKSGKHKKKKDDEPEAEVVEEGDTESVKERKRKKKHKGSKDSGKGSDASDTPSKKKRKKKKKEVGPEGVAEGTEGAEGEAGPAAEGDSDSIASEPGKSTPSRRSENSASASASASGKGGGGGGDIEDGRADIHFRGMYRKWAGVKDYSVLLPPVYKAFQRFWPWPPRKVVFFTSGYYFDWDDGEGDLKDNELMIHNIPPGTPASEIQKEFPSATKISLNPDGTAKIEFDTPAAATNAYNNSKLVKLGNRHLKWVRPDELYVLGIPPGGVNEEDIISDLPNATGVSFEDGPDGNLIATVKFRAPPDADRAYEEAPYKKLGNHQLGYTSGNNPIKLTNIPPGVSDDDIKKKFPTAKKVENKGNGTAKVYFDNDDDAGKSYDDSDMVKLGKPKLGWLRPEELYISDVPAGVSEKDLLKQFPKAKRVKFQNGEGGTRIATVVFPSEAEQKKAYDDSDWTKLGPQKLKFGGLGGKGKKKGDGGDGGGGGGGKGNLQLSNVPQGVTEADIKKRFPKASGVKIEKGTGNVKVQFKSGDDANQAYEDSDMVKLGKPKLGWIRPEELYVEGIPGNVGEDELMKQFPKAKRINWLKGDGGRRIAQVIFPNEEDQKSSYEDSDYTKLGPQKLGYKRPEKPAGSGTGVDQSDADMLAKWELAAKGFSNISNLFSGVLLVSGLPPHIKGTDLLKLIPGATSVDFTKGKKGQAHVIFNDPSKAAHAFGVAKNVEFDGHKINVHIMKGGGGGGGRSKGGKKKGSGKGSSKSSSGKSKK